MGGVIVDGLEVDGGTGGYPAYTGGGVRAAWCWGNVVTNCRMYGSNPGFLGMKCADVEVVDCEIDNNSMGLHSYEAASYTVRRCSIHNSSGDGWYGAYDYGSIGFYNCNIYSNGDDGVWTYWRHLLFDADGDPLQNQTIENCTVYANGGDGVSLGQASWTVRNTIMAGNQEFGFKTTYASNSLLDTCLFWTNILGSSGHSSMITNWTPEEIIYTHGGTNVLVVDPQFADYPSDVRLNLSSPCIDAGTTPVDTSYDLYGNRRLVGRIDIGSYEAPGKGTLFLIR